MADVELIIKIPEEVYKAYEMDHNLSFLNTYQKDIALRYLINGLLTGKLLEKGHERLIILSEDAVKKEQTLLSFSHQKWISEVGLSNATVAIIEADKEDKG